MHQVCTSRAPDRPGHEPKGEKTMTMPYRNFRVRIEAQSLDRGGVQSVSGLERTTEVEPYREGGVNDHDIQLITKTVQATLVLKR